MPQDHVPTTKSETCHNTLDMQVQKRHYVKPMKTAHPVIFFVVQNHMLGQLKQFAKQHKHLLKDFWLHCQGAACSVLSRLGFQVVPHPPCISLFYSRSHSAGDVCGQRMQCKPH